MGGLTETSQVMSQPDLWGTGLKTLAMLCIVVAVLILVLFLIKRFSYLKHGSGHGQFIKILSFHHVTPKERIALIDVVGEKIVIGITPENITFLTKIEKSEALERIESPEATGAAGGLFAKLLTSSLRGKGRPIAR
ncbi:MAG: flagellar biosynthetic protein FliO [Deltaproteobacteria bacterium]|nr:MAG: flagellar biosynthetic protein FliO [Deltaproteobacteria bacterium]